MATPVRNDTRAGSVIHRGGGSPGAMPPRASGAIETHTWRDGWTVTLRARVRAYGHRYRIDFGTNHEGWSVQRARGELDRILEQSNAAPGSHRAVRTGPAPRSTPRRPST